MHAEGFNEPVPRAFGTIEEEKDKAAAPFVKWAGGKRSIINALVNRLPATFNRYFEPFVGGGALFFALGSRLTQAFLSDSNPDLILTYRAVKKEPMALLARLKKHAKKHSAEYYYTIRKQKKLRNPLAIAARFLYLNKTCFNGLYRVNKSGQFNVPMGRYVNPGIVQQENLLACSRALKKTKIASHEFNSIAPLNGDFVYFDPPYHPMSDTSFTSYTTLDFSEDDQVRLRDFALTLSRKGIFVMISNSDTPFIRKLYPPKTFNVATVQAPRSVNCKASERGRVDEVVITNY